MEAIDEVFLRSNIEYVQDDANPDDLLNRAELLEFLMRAAAAQRKNVADRLQAEGTGSEPPSVSACLKILLEKYMRPYIQAKVGSLVDFRDRQFLFMPQVNVLLEANYRGLNLLYKEYQTKGYDTLFSLDSLGNMLADAGLAPELPVERQRHLFAFSKMTIVNECHDSIKYFSLNFLEFQVLLGLISKVYFDEDLGLKHDYRDGGRAAYLEIYREAEGEYTVDKLLHLLGMLCKLVGLSCQTLEDVENQANSFGL